MHAKVWVINTMEIQRSATLEKLLIILWYRTWYDVLFEVKGKLLYLAL